MNIGYVLQGYPVKSQTWIPLEVEEFKKRGYNISIIDIEKPLNKKTIKNCDFLLCHFSYQGYYARRWGIPFGVISHAYDIWRDNGKILKTVAQSKNCKFVGCITQYHKKKYIEWGINNNKLYMTPVCCDTDFFHKKKDKLGNKIIAGGRYKEKKGLEYAAKGFDDIYIYGKGREMEKLKQINPNISLLGWISKEEYRNLMDDSWLYVSPNIRARDGDMDGQPTTIKEAMLMELQVLTTNIAGNREYQNVYFSTVDDISKGFDGEVFNTIPKRRNTKGREFVLKHFSPKVCIDQYLYAIESII